MAPTRPTTALKKGCAQQVGAGRHAGACAALAPAKSWQQSHAAVHGQRCSAYDADCHDGAQQDVCGADDQALHQAGSLSHVGGTLAPSSPLARSCLQACKRTHLPEGQVVTLVVHGHVLVGGARVQMVPAKRGGSVHSAKRALHQPAEVGPTGEALQVGKGHRGGGQGGWAHIAWLPSALLALLIMLCRFRFWETCPGASMELSEAVEPCFRFHPARGSAGGTIRHEGFVAKCHSQSSTLTCHKNMASMELCVC
jgi:hypothetical protein